MATPPSATPAGRLPINLLVAFVLPTVILGIMHGPEGQVQAIYAKHAGLALAALATAMLLTKTFDAVTYPLIGTLSDRSHARSGTRGRWVIAGTALSMVGVWFLLRPPQGVSIYYFGAWMAVTYLGWKVIEIPLQAWSYGLTPDYAQRARVQSWRVLAMLVGQLLFFAVPFIAKGLGFSDSTELDFRNLPVAAVICVVALPLAVALLLWRVPGGNAVIPVHAPQRFGIRQTLSVVRHNPPLLRLLAAFFPANALSGLSGGVAYLYIDTYMGLSKQFPAIMGVALTSSLVGIRFWTYISARFETHRVWAVSLILGGFSLVAVGLISPGPLALPMCFALYPVVVLTLSGSVLVFAMSADIVDYGRLHTGSDHGGLYGALFSFLQKSVLGVSAAAGVALAAAFGFDATATTQTTLGILGIKLSFALLPALGMLGAAAVIWNYPLNRARVAEIQAELAKRDASVKAGTA